MYCVVTWKKTSKINWFLVTSVIMHFVDLSFTSYVLSIRCSEYYCHEGFEDVLIPKFKVMEEFKQEILIIMSKNRELFWSLWPSCKIQLKWNFPLPFPLPVIVWQSFICERWWSDVTCLHHDYKHFHSSWLLYCM